MAVVAHVFVRDISAYNSLSYGRIACNGALDLRLYFSCTCTIPRRDCAVINNQLSVAMTCSQKWCQQVMRFITS